MMSAEVWMGYLVDHAEDYTVVQSPFTMNGVRVFGADSDATTLAVAGVLHRLQHETVDKIGIPDGIDANTVTLATSAHQHEEEATEPLWDLLLSDEATVVLARQGATVELPVLDVEIEVDPDFHGAIQVAWEEELHEGPCEPGCIHFALAVRRSRLFSPLSPRTAKRKCHRLASSILRYRPW